MTCITPGMLCQCIYQLIQMSLSKKAFCRASCFSTHATWSHKSALLEVPQERSYCVTALLNQKGESQSRLFSGTNARSCLLGWGTTHCFKKSRQFGHWSLLQTSIWPRDERLCSQSSPSWPGSSEIRPPRAAPEAIHWALTIMHGGLDLEKVQRQKCAE